MLMTHTISFKGFSVLILLVVIIFNPLMNTAQALETTSSGTIAVNPLKYSVNETSDYVKVNVIRSGGSSGTISVNYTTINGLATQPTDYRPIAGILNWDNGDIDARTITVPIVNDNIIEDPENFYVELYNINGGNLGISRAMVTINSEDVESPNEDKTNYETAEVDFKPNTLNLKSNSGKNSFTAHIKLNSSDIVNSVDISSINLSVNDTIVETQKPIKVYDKNREGLEMKVKFNKQQIINAINNPSENITLTINGSLNNGVEFIGSDTIKVVPEKI
ncbi:MAG: hypothetical protein FH758_01565 [Firmicutes bacterium]|nr:hypothetical protein [Bacillota bacterium]